VSPTTGKLDVMDDRRLAEHVKRLREAHPSLDDQLQRYREKRKAYEALREPGQAGSDPLQRRRAERKSLA
jgi:hypothetical protein